MRPDRAQPDGIASREDGGTGASGGRSRAYEGLDRAARAGIFALQQCEECAEIQYPPREVCVRCLSDRLLWKEQEPGGTLLAGTRIWRPYEARFVNRVPVAAGLVRLDAGPVALAMLEGDVAPLDRLRFRLELDADGHAVIWARGS